MIYNYRRPYSNYINLLYLYSRITVGHSPDGLMDARVHAVESPLQGQSGGRGPPVPHADAPHSPDGPHLVGGSPLVPQLLLPAPLGPSVAKPNLDTQLGQGG